MRIERRQMSNGCELTVRSIVDTTAGVPIFMWGGLFGTYLVWSRLAKVLRHDHPLYMVDYPHYALSTPVFRDVTLNMAGLADFQQELMAQLNIPQAVVIGWSFGTQVAAEFSVRHPDSVSALIVLNGVAGKPFSHISDPIFETIGIRPKLSQTVGWLTKKEEAISRVRRVIRRNEHPSRWAKRLGLVSPAVDELVMDAVIRDFVNIPAKHYNFYLQVSSRHDARSAAKALSIPLLAVSGTLDKLVPPKRTREFVSKKNPRAEFLLVKGGTHFVPLEYPKLLALKLEDFFKRNQVK